MRSLSVVILLGVALCGCGRQQPTAPAAETPTTENNQRAIAETETTKAVMGKWARSCALCHVNGEGGAPRIGNVNEWQPRLDQGEATLLTHTIEGFNNMPPLGYCMACEREDLRAMIRLMAGDG